MFHNRLKNRLKYLFATTPALTPLDTPTFNNLNPLKVASLADFVSNTIPAFLIWIAAPLLSIFFLINALKYLSSAGDPQGIEEAKMGMLYTAIGFVVVVGSWAAINFLKTSLGL